MAISIRELFSFNDLEALNSSPAALRDRFERHFNKRPDGISVNSETYYGAVKPALTEQYGHGCYKTIGSVEYIRLPTTKQKTVILGTRILENRSDLEATLSATVEGQWSETVSHTTSSTIGLTFSQGVKIEGVFEMGMSFSLQAMTSESKQSAKSVSESSEVRVTVPPRSSVKITIQATMKEQSAKFIAPIRVSGIFGANFPTKVQGHSVWFLSADTVLPKTSGVLNGIVTGVKAFDVQTIISHPSRVR